MSKTQVRRTVLPERFTGEGLFLQGHVVFDFVERQDSTAVPDDIENFDGARRPDTGDLLNVRVGDAANRFVAVEAVNAGYDVVVFAYPQGRRTVLRALGLPRP